MSMFYKKIFLLEITAYKLVVGPYVLVVWSYSNESTPSLIPAAIRGSPFKTNYKLMPNIFHILNSLDSDKGAISNKDNQK